MQNYLDDRKSRTILKYGLHRRAEAVISQFQRFSSEKVVDPYKAMTTIEMLIIYGIFLFVLLRLWFLWIAFKCCQFLRDQENWIFLKASSGAEAGGSERFLDSNAFPATLNYDLVSSEPRKRSISEPMDLSRKRQANLQRPEVMV